MLNAAEHPTTARWLPYATLTGAVGIFSIGAVFVRMAQAEHVPSLVIAALRFLFATPMLSACWRAHDLNHGASLPVSMG